MTLQEFGCTNNCPTVPTPLMRNASILPPLPPAALPMPKLVDTVGNALQSLAQVRLRVGIGKAQITFTVHTEIDAGQGGNATGLEQIIGQFLARPADLRDIRKGVEGSPRHSATDAWNRVQALDKDIPPPPKLRHHGLYRLLRTSESRQRRPL